MSEHPARSDPPGLAALEAEVVTCRRCPRLVAWREEVAATRLTERGATRADDRVTEAAMEDRKKEGYF